MNSKSSTPSLAMAALPSATMSSREIAELTGKRHDHVIADIRKMLTELHGEDRLPSFQGTVERANPSGGAAINSIVFVLPKRETLILVSGYSMTMRAKIIDRWQALEAAAAPASLNLRDIRQLAPFALQLIGVVQEQHDQLKAQAPKVAFAEAVGAAPDLQSIGDVAKALGTGERRLFAFMRDNGILMVNNLPFQAHIEAGRFRVVEKPWKDAEGADRIRLQTMVTGKGVTFLQQRLAKALEVAHA